MPDQDVIDINDPLLQQEMVEADPDADFFEMPPPPPDDRDYQVKILLGERGVNVKRQTKKTDQPGHPTGPLFLNFALELRIMDPDQPWDGAPLFDNATSIVMQSSGTSLLHGILRAVGQPAAGRMDLAALRDHALGVFASEPTCLISGKWEAQAKDQDGKYKTVKKGMKNFPLIDPSHPELGHSPYAEDKQTGEAARAQFRVNKYFQQ